MRVAKQNHQMPLKNISTILHSSTLCSISSLFLSLALVTILVTCLFFLHYTPYIHSSYSSSSPQIPRFPSQLPFDNRVKVEVAQLLRSLNCGLIESYRSSSYADSRVCRSKVVAVATTGWPRIWGCTPQLWVQERALGGWWLWKAERWWWTEGWDGGEVVVEGEWRGWVDGGLVMAEVKRRKTKGENQKTKNVNKSWY